MSYEGYRVACGCTCRQCGHAVVLEGVADADGAHYCTRCENYVSVNRVSSDAHSIRAVERRQRAIDRAQNRGELF